MITDKIEEVKAPKSMLQCQGFRLGLFASYITGLKLIVRSDRVYILVETYI